MQSDLNEKQKKAVNLGLGPALILAGPGSGKTTVILARIKHLIEKLNISPQNILVITYTKSAATEMKNRAAKILNNSKDSPVFGTVHSYFYSVLKRSYEYRNFSILTTKQKYKHLEYILKNYYPNMRISNNLLQDILTFFSKQKNDMDISKEIEKMGLSKEQFSMLQKSYDRLNYEQKQMDYDDILLLSWNLLKSNTSLLNHIRSEVKYILVDEFQDVNKIQYELISLLAGRAGNIFVVGDDDQSIYRFRGAGEENLRRYEKDFYPVQKVILDINYRCPKAIVKASANLIAHNEKRFIKELRSAKSDEGKILCNRFIAKDEERKAIVCKFKQATAEKSIAVLCRTNSQLTIFAELLKKEKINFYMREKPVKFYESPYMKPIVGYLMFACGLDRSRKRLFSFLNQPMRNVGRELFAESKGRIEQIFNVHTEDYHTKKVLLQLDKTLDCLAKMTPEISVTYILKVVGYERFVLENIKDLKSVKKFKEEVAELKERAKMYSTIREWMEYVKWEEETEECEMSPENSKDCHIFLYTFHGSKGLEFDTVFIPHLNEGSVPYGKKLSQEELEEERRMFYVALTRSKENVFVTYVENDTKKDTVSRFIKECAFTVSK